MDNCTFQINGIDKIFNSEQEVLDYINSNPIAKELIKSINRNIDTFENKVNSNETNITKTKAEIKESVNPTTFTSYSGAAKGGDTVWNDKGKKYNIGKQVNYVPDTLQKLDENQRKIVEDAYQQAVKDLGRKLLPYDWNNPNKKDENDKSIYFAGGLVRRDFLQAKASDAIFAISDIILPNEEGKPVKGKRYSNKINKAIVDGGTGYAVQMAINLGKPVYVFHQGSNKDNSTEIGWYKWESEYNLLRENTNKGKFVKVDTPILTEKFAGIGTREINEAGKQAIEDVYNKTFKSLNTNNNQNVKGEINNSKVEEKINISNSTKKSPYFEKDKIKFANANKLISRGSKDSSSEAYRTAVGDKANVGNYTSSDVVAISAEGNRSGRVKPDYKELEKAIEAGVTFITDDTKDRQRSYNIGEREVADYLMSKGYSEKGDGIWTNGLQNISNQSTKELVNPILEQGRYVTFNGETYIVTKQNSNGTWQIYNSTKEGTKAKKSVSEENLTLLKTKAEIINYKGTDYIVTPKKTIISLTTNKKMEWGEENGDRRSILGLAEKKSDSVSVVSTSTTSNNKGITIKIPTPKQFKTPKQKVKDNSPLINTGDKKTEALTRLGFKNNSNEIGLKALITRTIGDEPALVSIKDLLFKAIDNQKLNDLPVFIDNNLSQRGELKSNNGIPLYIKINPNKIIPDSNKLFTTKDEAEIKKVLLEEILHAVTKGALVKTNSKLVNDLTNIRTEALELLEGSYPSLNSVISKINEKKPLNKKDYIIYKLSNNTEFIQAFIQEPNFRKILADIGKDTKTLTVPTSILARLKSWLSDLFSSLFPNTKDVSNLARRAVVTTFQILEDSSILEESSIIKTKNSLISEFILKDDKGNNLVINNATEVAEFINNNVRNIRAFVNEDNTIDLQYIDSAQGTVSDYNISYSDEFEDFENITNNVEDFIDAGNFNLKSLTSYLNQTLKRLKDNKRRIRIELDETTDTVKQKELNTEIERINDKISKLSEIRNNSTSLSNGLEKKEVINLALEQLDEVERQLKSPILSATELLTLSGTVNFWNQAKDLLFTEEDYNDTELLKDFGGIQAVATTTSKKVLTKMKDYLESSVVLGNESIDTLMEAFKDVNWITSQATDISTTGNALLEGVWKVVKKANYDTTREGEEYHKKIDKSYEKIKNKVKGNNINDIFSAFKQKNKNGKLTQNYVHRYTFEYSNALNKVLSGTSGGSNAQNYLSLAKFYSDNQLDYSLIKLFPKEITHESILLQEKEEKRIIDEIGVAHYNEWYEKQSKQLENYKNDLEATIRFKKDNYKEEVVKVFDNKHSNMLNSDNINKEYLAKQLLEEKEIILKSIESEKYAPLVKFIKQYEQKNSPYYLQGTINAFKNKNKLQEEYKSLDITKLKEKAALQEKILDIDKQKQMFISSFNIDNNLFANKYFTSLPKQKLNNGDNIYDKDFEVIENDKDLKEFYDLMQDTFQNLSKYLPYSERKQIMYGGIPMIEKTMFEMFMGKGYKLGWTPIKTEMDKLFQVVGKENTNSVKDFSTNKIEEELSTGLRFDSYQDFQDKVLLKKIDYYKANPEKEKEFIDNPEKEADLIEKLEEETRDELAKDKSFDLVKIMKLYNVAVTGYKHKAKIEDSLKVAQIVLDSYEEVRRDSEGKPLRDSINSTISKKAKEDSFVNMKKQFDYYIDATMYNKSREINRGKIIYTKEESIKKKKLEKYIEEYNEDLLKLDIKINEIENKISKETNMNLKESLEKDLQSLLIQKSRINININNSEQLISKLGNHRDKNAPIDIAIKWNQWNGMGWNVIGGISNMAFGLVANIIEGSGNELYNNSQLFKAYTKVLRHSSLKNLTFNKWETDEAFKIRKGMNKLNILNDASEELTNSSSWDTKKKLDWLHWANINKRTEYINQAPLFIVMMQNTKYTTPNGKIISLMEGFNKDFNWDTTKYGAEPSDLIFKTKIKIDQLIKNRTHGNYDPLSPIMAKKTIYGRAGLQFRTWMIDGFRQRWGDRTGRRDNILELDIKGRYWSAIDAIIEEGWKGAGAMSLELLRKFIPPIGGLRNKYNPLESLKTNGKLTQTDVNNIRKTMTELALYIMVLSTFAIARGFFDDLDDDDPKKLLWNMLNNQSTRIKTDLLFYSNPKEFMKLIKDPVPALALVKDGIDITKSLTMLVMGEDEIKTGVNKGMSRTLRSLARPIPLVNKGYSIRSNGVMDFSIFDK